MKPALLLILSVCLVSACGSESSTPGNTAWPPSGQNVTADSYGYLLDSAVEGLRYKSGGHYGVTGTDGFFGYIDGETIEFYLGTRRIAYAEYPTELLTPYEFSTSSEFSTIDVLRLVQSLDDDADPDNGIQITEAVHKLAVSVPVLPLPYDFTTFNFTHDPIDPSVIQKLTAVTSAGTRGVVSASSAYWHFAGTLNSLIAGKETDMQSLAAHSTCSSDDQCVIVELETSDTSYCPEAGPDIIYSYLDIDQLTFNSLVMDRQYLIDAKISVEYDAGASDSITGVCIKQTQIMNPVCNVSSRCEIE